MAEKEEGYEGFCKLGWELLEDRLFKVENERHVAVHRVERARVPGGWLVRAYSATSSVTTSDHVLLGRGVGQGVGVGVGLTFVPDPGHTWTA